MHVPLFCNYTQTSGLVLGFSGCLDDAPLKYSSRPLSFQQRRLITSSPVHLSCPSLPTTPSLTPLKIHKNGEQLLKSPVLQTEHQDPVVGRRLGNGWISAPPGTCQRRNACAQDVPRQVTSPPRPVRPLATWLLETHLTSVFSPKRIKMWYCHVIATKLIKFTSSWSKIGVTFGFMCNLILIKKGGVLM